MFYFNMKVRLLLKQVLSYIGLVHWTLNPESPVRFRVGPRQCSSTAERLAHDQKASGSNPLIDFFYKT